MSSPEQADAALRIAIAALIGLAIGLERQWSGHATGPQARFAGLRTFLLLGLIGGGAGVLMAQGLEVAGAVIAAGAVLFAIVAFALAVQRPGFDLDATTEIAAIVVIVLGVIAGLGGLVLAAGAGSVVVLALYEKGRLHEAVRRVGEAEMRAALRFAVLALVVLPLLPRSWTVAGIELGPRTLWVVVLLFSAINFAAYLARRVVRVEHGYAVTGLLGGLISSTAITLDFARRSRDEPALARPLAAGVVAACTVLVPRVLVVSFVLNAAVGMALLPLLVPLLAVGAAVVAGVWRFEPAGGPPAGEPLPQNPLRLGLAIKMAVAFQAAMILIDLVRDQWAVTGVYASAAFLGTTDVDALTVSMNRVSGIEPALAARAVAIGVLANTLTKLVLAVALGTGRFRLLAGAALLALALAVGGMILLL